MRIAAIYIEEHEYLFNKPQAINFGGRFIYEFKQEGKNIIIEKSENELFIKDLFNLTDINSITNINAIVGQNGAGKSTLLDIIRSVFIEKGQAFPHSRSLFIIESEDSKDLIFISSYYNNVFLNINESFIKQNVIISYPNKIRTIYYSPHYDYKYNSDFDEIDNHDLSFDKILENDLIESSEKGTNQNGFPFSPAQELLFKNSLRQIEFLNSDLVVKQQIFKDIFHLQDHYEPILYFREYEGTEKDWNIPGGFRRILNIISEKIKQELKDWVQIRDFKEDHNVANQLEINKYILKRNVIKCILSLLYKQMEKDNGFLDKGIFPYDEFKNRIKTLDGYQTFILFTQHSQLKIAEERIVNIFKNDIVEKLLFKIYEAIEDSDDKYLVTNYSLRTSKEYAVEILSLQREFLNQVNRYYYLFYSSKNTVIIEDYNKVSEFINYMPYSRRLSSGENALLNLFSRIYNFLNTNLKSIKSRESYEHYIILLDEADLTFHPSWKKRYVKAILSTLPYFFDELKHKPSIQIIFTTHDPLTLSDIPNSNIIYIERRSYDDDSNILHYNNINRPQKTFGANISDLIADSFFLENSLIGDFSFDKIREVIRWLEDKEDIKNSEYYKKIIKIIDEPIVQKKLAEMYDNKMNSKFQREIITSQIEFLENLRKKLDK